MSSHTAIVARALGGPLEAISVPTPAPGPGEVLVRVEWASATPFDNWLTDFGMTVQSWPAFLGENTAGTVERLGEGVTTLKVGDKVFGFTHGPPKVKAFQEFAVLEVRRVGKLPDNISPQAAVTVPDNFVTAFWALTHYLGLTIPFDLPVRTPPPEHGEPILIWGGATSVGQYTLQLLKHAGYTNILTTASPRHTELLRSYGARVVLPYTDPSVASLLTSAAGGPITKVLDCIAHDKKTIGRYRNIVGKGAQVAILLPVLVSDEEGKTARLESGDDLGHYFEEDVRVVAVRAFRYQENKDLYEKLQPEVMPRCLAQGLVKPNKARVIESPTLLARVDEGLRLLREGLISGERVVLRISEV
ncbi:GroES-like protein [Vararia minispora EC-137]|uniref:GroES-like protein n=1 Tax=Vararia minispora EC-137 TaxID=1314806 RepID=A0ACB8Q810_9AGAM|nr:GroES-like protein [Vararia minispora EC-137]